jgi:murein DD-endopeptidase MepM/ murein hydrolase activator NlpD
VVFSGEQRGYGHTIVVRSQGGVETRYAHLSKRTVSSGEEVSRGEMLGCVGSSGRATGPHLHLEMTKSGRLLDPEGVSLGL